MNSLRKAAFIDRDGILNEVVIRGGKVSSPWNVEEFRFKPEAKKLVAAIRDAGYLIVVVTNQPDLARKNLVLRDLEEIHIKLRGLVELEAIEVCGSDDDGDPRRKPNPGMLLDSAGRLGLELAESIMIGDSAKDVLAGSRAGVKTVLLETGYNQSAHGIADVNCASFGEIIQLFEKP